MWVLEMADVTMPLWSLIIIGLIALGMVIFGSIPIAVTVGHRLKQIRIRSPIYMNSGVTSTASIAEKHLDAEKEVWEYPPKTRDILAGLIKQGEYLCEEMQFKDFIMTYVEPKVRRWLDRTSHDVWKAIPEHASYITANQGNLTGGEEIKYQGWNLNNALLHVSVDRVLMRLREVHSKIRVLGKEDSQT